MKFTAGRVYLTDEFGDELELNAIWNLEAGCALFVELEDGRTFMRLEGDDLRAIYYLFKKLELDGIQSRNLN